MTVDSIDRGIVLDHVSPGRAMEIYKLLKLDELPCTVALIRNVKSKKMGRKDIIKIDDNIALDLDALGFVDPGITVNIIENGVITGKRQLTCPKRLVNIARCRNPRCVTSGEPALDHVCVLKDEAKREYRCAWCQSRV